MSQRAIGIYAEDCFWEKLTGNKDNAGRYYSLSDKHNSFVAVKLCV